MHKARTDTPLRLRDAQTGTCFIVDSAGGKVYADQDDEGQVGAGQEVRGDLARRALESAAEYREYFEVAVPGNATPDLRYKLRGRLTQAEHDQLNAGEKVSTERTALQLHLDFFDHDLDGRITLAENYVGWRRLGFSRLGALVKAVESGLVFGWRHWGTIRVKGIERYQDASGIYDKNGSLDEARLKVYLAEFDARRRPLSFDEVIALLDQHGAKGKVSRHQFGSLFEVCARLNNGEKVVTRAQFRGLFDGSLLWLAASTPRNDGRRPLSSS